MDKELEYDRLQNNKIIIINELSQFCNTLIPILSLDMVFDV